MNTPEQGQDQKLHEEFSLTTRIPQAPLPSAQPNGAIFWMRFVVWISPAPLATLASVGLVWVKLGHDFELILALPIIALITFGCGYCDAFLATSVRKENGIPVLSQALSHSLSFTLMQILVGPFALVGFIAVIGLLYTLINLFS